MKCTYFKLCTTHAKLSSSQCTARRVVDSPQTTHCCCSLCVRLCVFVRACSALLFPLHFRALVKTKQRTSAAAFAVTPSSRRQPAVPTPTTAQPSPLRFFQNRRQPSDDRPRESQQIERKTKFDPRTTHTQTVTDTDGARRCFNHPIEPPEQTATCPATRIAAAAEWRLCSRIGTKWTILT